MAHVEAHITGTIWEIECAVGDTIEEGDTVAILESMKMEMPVEAQDGGTVVKILCEEGQAVSEGARSSSWSRSTCQIRAPACMRARRRVRSSRIHAGLAILPFSNAAHVASRSRPMPGQRHAQRPRGGPTMVSRRRAAAEKGKRKVTGRRPASAREEHVVLTLSPAQVEQILRSATSDERAGAGGMLTADQLSLARERRYRGLLDDRRLSRSLLAGLLVLACFPPTVAMGIADLARRLDMRTSTIHRYVSTLLAAGLLERDPISRQYSLAQ